MEKQNYRRSKVMKDAPNAHRTHKPTGDRGHRGEEQGGQGGDRRPEPLLFRLARGRSEAEEGKFCCQGQGGQLHGGA